MKIAVLSDIHGNLGALDAILHDIAQRDVDLIVNLGDILSGALQPVETADRLMALNLPTIRGNHERQVLAGDPTRMGPSDKMAYSLLQPKHTHWLAGLPESLRLFDDVLMMHGTPDSDLTYLLEVVTASGCRSAMKHEVAQRLAHIDASLILCGHTHLPRSVRLDDGRLIVNPGSVGLQAYEDEHPYLHRMETGSPHARYAIVERSTTGWSSQLLAIEYDWDTAAELAARNNRLDWICPLKTGYVK
ncbi:metallophosphoesterase [Aquitalea sp. LB_tupeE]|uniref:metallophosphoesterase family protein n=1 Tax=Aquitalea sp. LB_tupeE TaxID=2748078 RepID=UPI0015BAA14F|nr:metallophosphoesterase family protein [Aquitalea sp. LB_tupeE]NWK80408.1 metallophosphoesterase family protein [Aquitalea sp. LB_tupeE]